MQTITDVVWLYCQTRLPYVVGLPLLGIVGLMCFGAAILNLYAKMNGLTLAEMYVSVSHKLQPVLSWSQPGETPAAKPLRRRINWAHNKNGIRIVETFNLTGGGQSPIALSEATCVPALWFTYIAVWGLLGSLLAPN